MKLLPLVACAALLLVCGCRKTKPVDVDDPPESVGELLQPDSGLREADRQEFYHLTMGSELMPLAWLVSPPGKVPRSVGVYVAGDDAATGTTPVPLTPSNANAARSGMTKRPFKLSPH